MFETLLVLDVRLTEQGALGQILGLLVGANLLFLTGPALDLLAARLGHRGSGLRFLLFFVGLPAAVLLMAACLRF